MIKDVHRENRNDHISQSSNPFCSITALVLKLTHSLGKKMCSKNFCLEIIFLLCLIGKFHMNFTVGDVFEIRVSTEKIQCSFQWFISTTNSVNHLLSTNKGHKEASRAVAVAQESRRNRYITALFSSFTPAWLFKGFD